MKAPSGDVRWDSQFGRFVRKYGVTLLARRLNVEPSSVYHWLRGATTPRPATAIKIQAVAKGRGVVLSLDEIYQHFREVRSRRYATSSV